MEKRMWVWSICPWWNREVQITEFVKQWIHAQLHSEADASKDGQIRPHIRRPYPAGAWYGRIWKFSQISVGLGPDMISVATLAVNADFLIQRFLFVFVWHCWTGRYNIYEYNVDDLILCSLPHHDTESFVRILQMISLSNETSKWHWLEPSAVSNVVIMWSVLCAIVTAAKWAIMCQLGC